MIPGSRRNSPKAPSLSLTILPLGTVTAGQTDREHIGPRGMEAGNFWGRKNKGNTALSLWSLISKMTHHL